jgi:ribosomal protein L11 methyltransferase
MSEARYPFVVVDVGAEESDEASATLFDLGATGIEERDETTLVRGGGQAGSGAPSVGGAAGGELNETRVRLVASFPSHDEAHEAIAALPEHWRARLEEVVGDAWRDEWKKHFQPFALCPGVVVRPPWTEYEPQAGERVLELEPGRAFGTGLHETTSLVSGVLCDYASEVSGREVLDVGCGSGILSLAALVFGASSARAIDIDPDAAEVTRENAARNRMAAQVTADTTDVAKVQETYPIVLANIEANVLVPMAPALLARLAPGGMLVLSGLLAPDVVPGQLDTVRAAYAKLPEPEVRRKGEWVALVYRAPQ